MKIETYIDSLVSYAMNNGLAEPCDHQVLTNRILDILRKDDYEHSNETQTEDLEEILAGLLDYAVKTGICDDGITARDIFDTRIMGAVTPMPREVIGIFRYLYLQNVIPAGYKQHQDVAVALGLAEHYLKGRGAYRVHGGGFAGTIQAFVPYDMLDEFVAGMDGALGAGACHVLSIRPQGGVEMEVEA